MNGWHSRTEIYKSETCIDFYKKKTHNGKYGSYSNDTRKEDASNKFGNLIEMGYLKEEVGYDGRKKYSSLTNKGMLLCKIWKLEGTINKVVSNSEG